MTTARTIDPLVYVVLLNWKNWRDTVDCLESLASMDYSSWCAVIVDNASGGESIARIKESNPAVPIIENPRNFGFAGGCNVGIEFALEQQAEYVWLLNNDTVVDPGALTAMVRRAQEDTHLGAIGSVIYHMHEPERVQAWGGGHIMFGLGRSKHFLGPVPDERLAFLTGCSMLLRSAAIKEVGTLDERFFMYWEDSDLCLRLRNAGWRLATASDSKVWHKWRGSVRRGDTSADFYFSRSLAYFFAKHAPVPAVPIGISLATGVVKRLVRGEMSRARAACAGVRAAMSTLRRQRHPAEAKGN